MKDIWRKKSRKKKKKKCRRKEEKGEEKKNAVRLVIKINEIKFILYILK